jgi:acyl carrier protein
MGYNKYQIEEIIKDFIWEICDEDDIKKSYRLNKDLGLTEDDIMRLGEQIEDKFEITVYEEDMEEWTTVRDVIKFVLSNADKEW